MVWGEVWERRRRGVLWGKRVEKSMAFSFVRSSHRLLLWQMFIPWGPTCPELFSSACGFTKTQVARLSPRRLCCRVTVDFETSESQECEFHICRPRKITPATVSPVGGWAEKPLISSLKHLGSLRGKTIFCWSRQSVSSLLPVRGRRVLLAHSEHIHVHCCSSFCGVSSSYRVIALLPRAQTFYWLSSPCLYTLSYTHVPA